MKIKIFSGEYLIDFEQEVNDWISNNSNQEILRVDFKPLELYPRRSLNGFETVGKIYFYLTIQYQERKTKLRPERKNKYIVP